MESEDQCLLAQSKSDVNTQEFNKKSRISYTRKFLFSLAELDSCKRLPNGFDSSILCEVSGALTTTTYCLSDSGRCHGNLTQDSRQNPVDGILGNAFPRLSGCGSGASARTVQDKGYSLPGRCNEPYRPPHFYKAYPHSGEGSKNSYNDETFGSSECPSLEKVEEERKRRDSFQLMREEQNAIQEKQKKIPDEHKENVDPEIATFLEESRNDNRFRNKCNESVECVVSSAPNNDSAKCSTHTYACGELLPPDLPTRSLEKNVGSNSFTIPDPTPEQGDVKVDHPKSPLSNSSDVIHQFLREEKKPADGISSSNKNGDPKVYRVSNEKVTEQSYPIFSSGKNYLPHKLMESTFPCATNDNSEQLYSRNKSTVTPRVLNFEDFEQSMLSEVSENHSTRHHCDTEDRQPNSAADREKKPADGISSSNKNGDPKVYRVSNEEVTEQSYPIFSSGKNYLPHKLMESTFPCATNNNSEQLYSRDKSTVTPRVLNFENFEQSMLLEVSENHSTRHHCDTEDRQPNSIADRGASEYLLSLLQKGADPKDLAAILKLKMKSTDKVNPVEIGNDSNMLDISLNFKTENFQKNLTGRQIFGAGFTKDLQATEVSVSQKGFVGRVTGNDNLVRCGFPFPVDNSIIPLTEDGSIGISHESIISSGGAKPTGLSKSKGKQSRYDDIKALIGLDLDSEEETEICLVSGFHDKANLIDELCLPEEDSLITGDSLFPQDSMVMPAGIPMRAPLFTSKTSVDVAEKFATLNVTLSDKRSTRPDLGIPTSHSSFHNYYNPHAQQSYPPFHHSQMRPTRPFFRPSPAQEAHKIKPLNLKTNHNTFPGHLHFPTDVLANPFQLKHAEPTQLGNPVIQPMSKQMPIPGEFQLQLKELARVAPTHYPINEMACYAQEWSPMQNFPQNYQQQSYEGLETLIPDLSVGGNNNQAAFDTHFEMEARAKQMHPRAVASLGQGKFGRQVDMGFRFR